MNASDVIPDLKTLGVENESEAKAALDSLLPQLDRALTQLDEARARSVSPFSDVTFEQMQATLRRITYKPNFQLGLDEERCDGYSYRIMAEMVVLDANPGFQRPTMKPFRSYWAQPWPPSLDIFVLQVHTALIEMERHEASEWFRLDGQAVVDPHTARGASSSFAIEEIRKLLRKPVTMNPRDAERAREHMSIANVRWINEDAPFER